MDCLLLVVSWVLYFSIHSTLAALPVKRFIAHRWPGVVPKYRVLFNALAIALLVVPVYWIWQCPGPLVWAWTGYWAWLAKAAMIMALGGFLYSMRDYDGAAFLGIRQWQNQQTEIRDQEDLCISPLHCHVRHPWYFFGLILIWSQDMNKAELLSAVLITLYIVIGIWLEEKKLIAYHGDSYRQYRKRVPALVPIPGKSLSAKEAKALESQARCHEMK